MIVNRSAIIIWNINDRNTICHMRIREIDKRYKTEGMISATGNKNLKYIQLFHGIEPCGELGLDSNSGLIYNRRI